MLHAGGLFEGITYSTNERGMEEHGKIIED
jgi:hypothetical protein